MRKILKRIGAGILALSLVFTPNISALASESNLGGGQNASIGGGGKPLPGCGTSVGYCFRVMLYDVPNGKNGNKDKLWREISKDTYKMKSNVNKLLDGEAKNSAIYIGLNTSSKSKYRVFDSTRKSGSKNEPDYRKIDSKRIISDKAFNKIPGMGSGAYSSSHLGRDSLDWTAYFNKDHPNKSLNRFAKQTANSEKMDDLIEYFESKKRKWAPSGKYDGVNTMVVVEPMVIWSYNGFLLLVSFQNAINLTGKAHDRLTKFYPGQNVYLEKNKNGNYTVGAQGTKARKRIAQLGGVKQSQVVKANDCRDTEFYSPSSGYVCFGTERVENSSKVGSNVAVVCDTEPSEDAVILSKNKIKSYQAVNYKEGSGRYIYNHTKDRFGKKTTTKTHRRDKLGVPKDKDVDDYSIVYSGIFTYTPHGQTKGYKRVYNVSNIRGKMLNEMDEGKVKHLELKWSYESIKNDKDVADTSEYVIGTRYKTANLRVKYDRNEDYDGSVVPLSKYVNSHLANFYGDVTRKEIKLNKFYKKNMKSTEYMLAQMDSAIESSSGEFTKKSGVKAEDTLGLGVELLVKNKRVTNHIVTINVKGSDSVSIKHTSKGHGTLKTVDDKKCYTQTRYSKNDLYAVVVPNYSPKGYSESVADSIANACKADDVDTAISNFYYQFGSGDKIAFRDYVSGGETISLGSASNNKKVYGYTLYILQYKNKGGKPEKVKGDLELKDYELNYVFPSMCEEATNNGNPKVVTLRQDLCTVDINERYHACSSTYWYPFPTDKSYQIIVTEKGSKGKTIEKDDSLSGTKMLLTNTKYISPEVPDKYHLVREKALNGILYDTNLGYNYRIDYGFNLSRGLFGDRRSVSTISDQTINPNFASKVLDLNYGNMPQDVKEASSDRDSNATVGDKIVDTFVFDAIYRATGSKTKYTKHSSTCYHWHWSHGCEVVTEHEDELLAFSVNGVSASKVEIEIDSTAHKYSTEANEVGTNSVASAFLRNELRLPKTNGTGMTETLTDDNKDVGYTAAYVKNSDDIVLSFYPEVAMQAIEYSGNKIETPRDGITRRVLTMGEEKRNANSSSLYLFTLRKDDDGNDLSGTTYSDTAVGGSKASKISDMVTLTAGGDFGVAVKETGFHLNLYGYSLDVINKANDESMQIAQTGVKDMLSGVENSDDVSINYTDIIKDGSDVYSDWGNNHGEDATKNEFLDWVEKITDVNNFKADIDMELSKDGSSTPLRGSANTNFNSTIGSLSGGEEGVDMAFPLTIRHGQVAKYTVDENGYDTSTIDPYYEKFISQLASDYGLIDDNGTRFEQAEKLFKSSGLYTSIINAIESDKSDENNSLSQSAQSRSQRPSAIKLGNNTHWYDEEVKTIVLRRFAYEGVHFQNITANDKLDLGDAVTSGSTDQKYTGKFGLTISITQKFKDALSAQNIQFGASTAKIIREKVLDIHI